MSLYHFAWLKENFKIHWPARHQLKEENHYQRKILCSKFVLRLHTPDHEKFSCINYLKTKLRFPERKYEEKKKKEVVFPYLQKKKKVTKNKEISETSRAVVYQV